MFHNKVGLKKSTNLFAFRSTFIMLSFTLEAALNIDNSKPNYDYNRFTQANHSISLFIHI